MLAEPIVRLLYQRGDFTADADAGRRPRLAAFSLGLTFNGTMLMLNRAFFSLQSPWIPTWVALGNLGLNAALDAAFYRLGIWGIPLSTSLVNIAGTAALLVLLRRRLGRIELGETARHRPARRGRLARCSPAACVRGLAPRSTPVLGRSSRRRSSRSAFGARRRLRPPTSAACRLLGVRELETLLAHAPSRG